MSDASHDARVSDPLAGVWTKAAFALVARRVVTCDEARGGGLGALDEAGVLVEAGRIALVGAAADVEARAAALGAPVVRAAGVVTPGLVDAHTHLPWAGSRANEYALRMRGAGYEEIAAAGGGIVATMRAVRAARTGDAGPPLARLVGARLARMARSGVTTVEAKSGYGLDEASERAQLEALRDGASALAPRVVPTFLGLHALPPEARGDRAAYVATAIATLTGVARDGLARFVDAYVDRNAFAVEHAEPFFEVARRLGLGVRVHAGQFADVGGAELAARFGARSADHLEHVGEAGCEALARAGTRAVLLPTASFTLGQAPPPVDRLRAWGVRLVVASDANPGTAPTESLPLALALAVRVYGLSVVEALLGATREAAAALDLGDETGVLREGLSADLVAWDFEHEDGLAQPWGAPRAALVVGRGAPLFVEEPGRLDLDAPAVRR